MKLLVYWTRMNKTFSFLQMMKQTRINWGNRIKQPINGSLPDEVQHIVKARVNRTKRLKRHAPNKVRERPNYWQWCRSFILGDSIFPSRLPCGYYQVCRDSPELCRAHMCTWFSASLRRFWYDRKCLFSCIYNPQITISPTSLFSVNFNGNHVKNHPKPWTCPLSTVSQLTQPNPHHHGNL